MAKPCLLRVYSVTLTKLLAALTTLLAHLRLKCLLLLAKMPPLISLFAYFLSCYIYRKAYK